MFSAGVRCCQHHGAAAQKVVETNHSVISSVCGNTEGSFNLLQPSLHHILAPSKDLHLHQHEARRFALRETMSQEADENMMDIDDSSSSSSDESTEAAAEALLAELQRLRTEQERLSQENSVLLKSMEGVIQAFQTTTTAGAAAATAPPQQLQQPPRPPKPNTDSMS